MYTVDPPVAGGVVADWPGGVLVMAHGTVAVLTAEGLVRRGPELVAPRPAPDEGVLLFVDHRAGRAGALPLHLTGPAVDLGPATRVLGSTVDRLVFLVDHTPQEPLVDPYDVQDEWEYQERLAERYGGRDVVRAVSLDSGAVVRAEVHQQDLRDARDWAAVSVLRDGRLVLMRSPSDLRGTVTEIALLGSGDRWEPYGDGARLLGQPGAAVLVTEASGPAGSPHRVLIDHVAPPGVAWRAVAPDGWRVFGALALLPGGAVLCSLHEDGPLSGRCLAVAEPAGDLVPMPGSRGAQPDQVGLAVLDGSRVVFGGLRTDGAAWYATSTVGSATPATQLPVSEQVAWARPYLLAALPLSPQGKTDSWAASCGKAMNPVGSPCGVRWFERPNRGDHAC